MKKTIAVILLLMILIPNALYPIEVYQNFVQVYGEGPVGQHIYGFETRRFNERQATEYARAEIYEFLAGLIYGYHFKYKVENPITERSGYFELEPFTRMNQKDRNLRITQFQKKEESIRFQATYRLTDHQKNYIKGFQSSLAKMSMGEAFGPITEPWESRLQIFKDAVQNAVLNEARRQLKSRPLFIEGRLLLIESPRFAIIAGEWRVSVKIHLMIQKIQYEDVY